MVPVPNGKIRSWTVCRCDFFQYTYDTNNKKLKGVSATDLQPLSTDLRPLSTDLLPPSTNLQPPFLADPYSAVFPTTDIEYTVLLQKHTPSQVASAATAQQKQVHVRHAFEVCVWYAGRLTVLVAAARALPSPAPIEDTPFLVAPMGRKKQGFPRFAQGVPRTTLLGARATGQVDLVGSAEQNKSILSLCRYAYYYKARKFISYKTMVGLCNKSLASLLDREWIHIDIDSGRVTPTGR